MNLRKATRAVTQLYDRHLRPSGLKGTQFSILAVLANTGTITLSRPWFPSHRGRTAACGRSLSSRRGERPWPVRSPCGRQPKSRYSGNLAAQGDGGRY
jgi:hypothetical protein